MLLNKKLLLFLLPLLTLFACSPYRHIPEGKYILTKNEIVTDTEIVQKEKLETFLKQKPNRLILGIFPFHLWVYNLGTYGKPRKINNWLKSIGEEPALLDSGLMQRTKEQLDLFLNKNGFFESMIKDSVITKRKKARVIYSIKYNKPYTIRVINYATSDSTIAPLINSCQKTSLIIPGDRYDEDVLDKERDKIAGELKDHGYYFFNKNYINFIADTGLRSHQLDLFLYVNRINENVDPALIGNSPIVNHQSYKLRNIYIQTNYNPKDPASSIPTDTVFFNGYYFLNSGYSFIRYQALLRNIFVHTGDTYLQRDLDYTYRRLQELNVFKFINLYFNEVPRDSLHQEYLLDLSIQLTPSDKQDVSFELETTNTGGNLGGALSVAYRNRNTFRGAEMLEVRSKFGLEAIPNFNDSVENRKLLFFNSLEVGPQVTLTVKKFFLPDFIINKTSPYSNPKTNFSVGYNYQDRPDYKRSVTNLSMSYQWTMGKRWRTQFFPLDINSVNVSLSPSFRRKLEGLNDPRLLYTYDTHVISGLHVTFFYSDQGLTRHKNFVYFRTSLEATYKAVDQKFNPSQYTKYEIDFSYHKYINPFNNVVYRIATGIGLPYGTSRALPFEKSFFSGGANSIRAWSARTLGPGSYKRTLFIEQSGDIKIETNLEYRSEILRFPNGIILEGATFIDAGNVWTRNEDKARPGGKFEFSNFLSEMGIGGGAGLRFNFSFFILRLDGGIKLHDPALPVDARWVYSNKKFVIGDITGSLAIGYPF